MDIDIEAANRQLRGASPEDIIRWALSLKEPAFASTSFSPNSGALLHMISTIAPELPVVWVDSGYNVPDAYRVAEKLIRRLDFNLRTYTPTVTPARREAILGGIPHPDDNPELHKEFTRQVKLEPFQRAIEELQPVVWITGIRRDETDFRKTLDIVSRDNRGLLRVAPLFEWAEDDLEAYMEAHELPSARHYFDPTKIGENAECGLHTAA